MRKTSVFLILSLAIILTGCQAQTPKTTEPPPDMDWVVNYIEQNPTETFISYNNRRVEFALTPEQIAGIVPEDAPGWLEPSGEYYYQWVDTQEGLQRADYLDSIQLTLSTSCPDSPLSLTISRTKPITITRLDPLEKSTCNGIDYWVFQYTMGERVLMEAIADIRGYWYWFRSAAYEADVPQAKEDLRVVLGAFTYYGQPDKPDMTFFTPDREVSPPILWTPVYNDHECGLMVSRSLPVGATERDLTREEIETLVPHTLLADMETTGYARFLQDGSLFYVVLQMKLEEESVTISLGQAADWSACCMSLSAQNGEVSQCGDVAYRLYCNERPYGKSFIACGQLDGEPILVRTDTKNPERIQGKFEHILRDFAYYRGSDLNLDILKAN